jgi:hypothetical protein
MFWGSIMNLPLLQKLTLDLSNNSITQAGLTSIKPLMKNLKKIEEININLDKSILLFSLILNITSSQIELIREKKRDYYEFAAINRWFSKIPLREENIQPIFPFKTLKTLII